MAKNNNLKDFLTDLYEGIVSKKPNASRNPQDFRSEIENIETGVDTTDATATSGDILKGKTAYINDVKVEGNIGTYNYSTDEHGVIVENISNIDIYFKDEGRSATNLEESIKGILGVTPNIVYYIVDELPIEGDFSDLQTFQKIFVYITNNIPYVYGNVGYGNMWIDVVSIVSNVTGVSYEIKGYISDYSTITEPGLYVTYKISKQIKMTSKDGITLYTTKKYVPEDISVILDESLISSTPSESNEDSIIERTITKIEKKNIKTVGSYAFAYCRSLTEASFPACTSIGGNAFYGCNSLTSINSPMCEYIGSGAFSGCTSLSNISFPMCTSIGSNAFYYCPSLQEVSLPMCTNIENSAFYYCTSLQTVSFPVCTYIGGYVFIDCSSLTSVNSPLCAHIGYSAFYSCHSLSNINFPVCTSIGGSAFNYCTSLQEANFPVCTSIGNGAFGNCTSLKSVSFPQCSRIFGNTFISCASLQEVNFPMCTGIGSSAFYGCSSLQEVSLPMCTNIENSAFGKCISLSNISFPACTSIGNGAFGYCFSLTSVNFPVCTSIGNGAFSNCSSLTNISFPMCSIIGSSAFYSCNYLQSIYLNVSSVPQLGSRNAFQNTPLSNSSYLGRYGSIYVPGSLYEAFRSATSWTLYSQRIVSYNFE